MITTVKQEERIPERFLKMADQYLPFQSENGKVQSYEEYYSTKLKNLENNEFLIPVLGVQGTGKSSLLNALLMDDIVLPVDADETTCIPVEIRYSEDLFQKMEVHFQYNPNPTYLTDSKELEQYVHNDFNFGNEKNVSHIVIYNDSPILKNGVVFVDLPGVSSLTQQNMKTTMSYIEKLSAAIFLLRTVPPITKSEKVFLSTVWPKLTKAWFIQNQWNDESKREVQEGLEHNKSILEEIAAKHHTNESIDIQIVNVYQALAGRLQERKDLIEESGLDRITQYISSMTKEWKGLLTIRFREDLKLLHQQLLKKLKEQFEDVQLDRKDLRKKYREQEDLFEEKINENQEKILKIKIAIQQYELELSEFAVSESKVQAENLRNEMRRVTGNHIVDGEKLATSFRENQQMIAMDAIESLNDKIFEVRKTLEVDLGALHYQNADGSFEHVEEFYKKEAFKLEKALPATFGIGGGIGGAAAGFAIGGPLGAAVGFGIGLIASFIGSKSKQYVDKVRQDATIQDLEAPIQAFQEKLQKTIAHELELFFTTIRKGLEQFVEMQECELEARRKEHRAFTRLTEEELEETRKQLEDDISLLAAMEVTLS